MRYRQEVAFFAGLLARLMEVVGKGLPPAPAKSPVEAARSCRPKPPENDHDRGLER